MKVINLEQKYALFSDFWNPKIVGSLNGQDIKLAKIQGEFIWHKHEHEDELFYVVRGTFDMHFEKDVKTIRQGEMIIVPKGVLHKPVAEKECWIMLFEPNTTRHTGDIDHEMTISEFDKI